MKYCGNVYVDAVWRKYSNVNVDFIIDIVAFASKEIIGFYVQ